PRFDLMPAPKVGYGGPPRLVMECNLTHLLASTGAACDLGGTGAPEAEIEVTPEMIEAGADVVWRHYAEIMARARRVQGLDSSAAPQGAGAPDAAEAVEAILRE